MPINLTGPLMGAFGALGGVSALATNAQIAKKKEKEEAQAQEEYNKQLKTANESKNWGLAPETSPERMAYDKAATQYYNAINAKAIQKDRLEYIRNEWKGVSNEFTENDADIYITGKYTNAIQNAQRNIQKQAVEALKSPAQKANESAQAVIKEMKEKYGGNK